MEPRGGFVYILTNSYNTVLYVGVTADLKKRIYEHKQNLVPGFTQKYNVHKLVYFEPFESIEEAIAREKYLKGKKREYRKKLIEDINPAYTDLYDVAL